MLEGSLAYANLNALNYFPIYEVLVSGLATYGLSYKKNKSSFL